MASSFEILPEVVAKDALAPVYRLDDPQWGEIVGWVMEALVQAEESGVTQASVAAMRQTDDPSPADCWGRSEDTGNTSA